MTDTTPSGADPDLGDAMTTILVATTSGLYRIGQWPELLHIEPILDLAGDYVLVAGYGVQKGFTYTNQYIDVPEATSLLWTGSELFAGTGGAHLVKVGVDGDGNQPVTSFDDVKGRETWHQPHGGPPAVRTMAVDDEGRMYVNVHVGGIVRSDDGGRTWQPTIEVDVDVHQVATVPGAPGMVLAATAKGLATSDNYGKSWKLVDDGLHARYARAVAVSDDMVFLSVSEGPSGKKASVYRRPLAGTRRFGKVRGGLPELFAANVDSGCIAASGKTIVVGAPDGRIHRSTDNGLKWHQLTTGLPPVTRIQLVAEDIENR
ncbi:MAG TPA: hypothetical protein VM942_11285 [Acidimicrobiales bacterium]|nr:hypothetical protein [Acidimicrobiales bacterium]